MTVREAKKADLDGICRLSNEINADHYSHMPLDFVKPDGSNRDEAYWLGFISMDSSAVFVTEDNVYSDSIHLTHAPGGHPI